MSKSREALDRLAAKWVTLAESRPGERDFSAYGYPGIDYDSIGSVIIRWRTILDALEEKKAWTATPELLIADTVIAGALDALGESASSAGGNGVDWLVRSSSFMQGVVEVGDLISGLPYRRLNLAKEVAKHISERGLEEVAAIIAASEAASSITRLASDARSEVENVSNALTQALSDEAEIEKAKARAEQNEAEIKRIAEAVEAASLQAEQSRKDAAKSQIELASLKEAAARLEDDLGERARAARDEVAALSNEAEAARNSVVEALRLARAQGLALAFQNRSLILNYERRRWVLGFLGSGVVLLSVGIIFVLELQDVTYEAFAVTLLKKLALIAPVIWVGWYCAKQIGRVARIQEDYEYKAASALAYQSYKEEASHSADEDLRKQLLTRAIETFGENPVRLYEDTKTETSSPLEELLSKAKPEKLADVLAAALSKALNK